MSSETIYLAPRRYHVAKVRAHDYLYDSAYIVSGARDYARTAFKAAMDSAQLVLQPVYNTMFSELRKFPRVRVVYHPNCRLPSHIDTSYPAYLRRTNDAKSLPPVDLDGRDRFIFGATPKKVLPLASVTPNFQPTTPRIEPYRRGKPRNRGMQTIYRESSAQTYPWQPDAKVSEECEDTPEVIYLDKLEWGPGIPYRTGDLPADFHTTEIINKMRHARKWQSIVEKAEFPRWMKKTDGIIGDVETRDWVFREAEIDELQDIRLTLLHKQQAEQRRKQTTRASRKLEKLWEFKKGEMQRKIAAVHHARDRELRKVRALHSSGGSAGRARRQREARGGGRAGAAADPASELCAAVARHGAQGRRRHARVVYDLALLDAEDHEELSMPPPWLDSCGQDLTKTCSGHHLGKDPTQLCERETKWSEKYLQNLHEELKMARLGAATSQAPLRVLKPRHVPVIPRPQTPEVGAVPDDDETNHQSALLIQRIIRGRAVQNLMYEGRTRASELIEELKSTHGLQEEDKIRIANEEIKARNYEDLRTDAEKREAELSALVEELYGSSVSTALDFLEKELRRLKDERRQHAFIIIAQREKTMREAAEAGRRQKEERRRTEHDEMFKQILGVTQETVDAYLREIVEAGVEHSATLDAETKVLSQADKIDASLQEYGSMSTAEQNETIAELVHQFLLPEVHKSAARERIGMNQRANLVAARETIFGILDDAEIKKESCAICGESLGDTCLCKVCPIRREPVEKPEYRYDPRWKYTRGREVPVKTISERYPPYHEFRCMLNILVDEAVIKSRYNRKVRYHRTYDCGQRLREKVEIELDMKDMFANCLDRALDVLPIPPVKTSQYRHYMTRVVSEAMDRSVPFQKKRPCPEELPTEIRRKAEELAALEDPTCRCEERPESQIRLLESIAKDPAQMLPSELRVLEELRRCKCDEHPMPSPISTDFITEEPEVEFDSDTTVYLQLEKKEEDDN